MLNKFFVYGTLKADQWNDRDIYRKNRISVEKAVVVGRIFAVASFPGVKLTGDGVVYGEVHTYPEEKLAEITAAMDSLEGYKEGREYNHYNRKIVKATLENGKEVDAYIYEYAHDVFKEIEIESGEWKEGCHEPIHRKAGKKGTKTPLV
jgi:gamma-glutamylcyclotransferase (GGCT)/AIG2-like uncharacterized protein YtfP